MFFYTKILQYYNCILFLIFISRIKSEIKIFPKELVTTVSTTRFFVTSSSIFNCSILLFKETKNGRVKRSLTEFNDLKSDKSCPGAKLRLENITFKIEKNDSKFITETPESIILTDESFIKIREDFSVNETTTKMSEDLQHQQSEKPELKPVQKKDGTSLNISDWLINTETLKPTLHLLHLKYAHTIEMSVKAKYEVECANQERSIDQAFLYITLNPLFNLTQPGISLNKRQFSIPYFLEEPPCSCDLTIPSCDKNCCCDKNCSKEILDFFNCPTPLIKKGELLKQPTGLECTSTSKTSLCVTRHTSSFIDRLYPTEPILKSIKAFLERTSHSQISTTLMKPPSLKWRERDYIQGTPLQIKTNEFQFLTIPKRFFGDSCLDSSPILFLINQNSTCTIHVTKATCENGNLNIDSYRRAEVNATFLCVTDLENYGNCKEENPVTKFTGSDCLNSVVEAKYNFYWNGPRIDGIEVVLKIIPKIKINETLNQVYAVTFKHVNTSSKNEKKEKILNEKLIVYQQDLKGYCTGKFSYVDVGENIFSTCWLRVEESSLGDCMSYRDYICRLHDRIWESIEMKYNGTNEVLINKNYTLCNSSSSVYNTCMEIPLKSLIEVIHVDLAKKGVPSFKKVLGIQMRLEATHCYPPVGFGTETSYTSHSIEDHSNKDKKFHTVLCEPKKEVLFETNIKFQEISQKDYSKMVRISRHQNSMFDHLLSDKIITEYNYLFSDKNYHLLSYTLKIFLTFALIIIISLFFITKLK